MWHLLGEHPGSSSLVMAPAGTISKDDISYIFDGKMGFDGILEDSSFYINSSLLIPKPLAIDLNAY